MRRIHNLVLLFGMFMLTYVTNSNAQSVAPMQRDLPLVHINTNSTIHFIAPEEIQYVDISSHAVSGDLPIKNVLRIRIHPDTSGSANAPKLQPGSIGVLTITGENFIAQYNLCYSPNANAEDIRPKIDILPEDTRPLDVPGISLTKKEMQNYALALIKRPGSKAIRKTDAFGLFAQLNQVYTVGDHVLLDVSYFNKTKLPYTIDEQRFKVEDKKVTKATNVQSVEVPPVWQLYPGGTFKKQYRNVYVLKKLMFPGNKVLNIKLTEKQISGRALTLQIKYSDILDADTL